jgi:hypothetical protein
MNEEFQTAKNRVYNPWSNQWVHSRAIVTGRCRTECYDALVDWNYLNDGGQDPSILSCFILHNDAGCYSAVPIDEVGEDMLAVQQIKKPTIHEWEHCQELRLYSAMEYFEKLWNQGLFWHCDDPPTTVFGQADEDWDKLHFAACRELERQNWCVHTYAIHLVGRKG